MPSLSNNNREAVVICARHVVKRPSKRSALVQWCSRNSKSHFAQNLLAIRGTKLTLNARLGTKSNLLIEQYCY